MITDYIDGPTDQPWEYTLMNDGMAIVQRRGYSERFHTTRPLEVTYSADHPVDRFAMRYLAARLNERDALRAALTRLCAAIATERASQNAYFGRTVAQQQAFDTLNAAEQAAREVLVDDTLERNYIAAAKQRAAANTRIDVLETALTRLIAALDAERETKRVLNIVGYTTSEVLSALRVAREVLNERS